MTEEQKSTWLTRLKAGLGKSSAQLGGGVGSIFAGKQKLDQDTLDELQELLILSDVGVKTATILCDRVGAEEYPKGITPDAVRRVLAREIAHVLEPSARDLRVKPLHPHVVLVVGVNGNGKTTTIGKMAKQLLDNNYSVALCAADTFRAAAVEQLQVWGQRNNVPVYSGQAEADPASVAYFGLESAKADGVDVLLIDTAGRLQNKNNLMAELQKLVKVLQKLDPSAPHSIVQIVDATTGQNAISQVKLFSEAVKISGLVVTKLDGTARAGIVVALAEQFDLPIHAIGVGEGIDDLRDFTAQDFADNLVGAVA